MRTLMVTLEIDCRDMTQAELEERGLTEPDEADPEDGWPALSDYTPDEIANLIPHVLASEDVTAEMFAGSAIFAKITGVRVASARFQPQDVGGER